MAGIRSGRLVAAPAACPYICARESELLLSASAPPTQLGIFLAAFSELPRARPIPIVLAGATRPAWAHPDFSLCSRPYREPELLGAVRATLTLLEDRARAEARAASVKHLERVPGDALMLP